MNKLLVCVGVAGCLAASSAGCFADDGFQGLLDDYSSAKKSTPSVVVDPVAGPKANSVSGKEMPAPLVAKEDKKRPAIDWSVWVDYGASMAKKTALPPDTYIPYGFSDPSGNWSLGLGIQVFRYLGLRGWYGDASSSFEGDGVVVGTASSAMTSGCESGTTSTTAQRCSDYKNMSFLDFLVKYQPGSKSLGRIKIGKEFGYDMLFFWPVTEHLTVFGGPGVAHYSTAEYIAIASDRTILFDKRREVGVTGSAGFNFRPIGQFWGKNAPFNRLMLSGGYHTERGVTFGAGVGF